MNETNDESKLPHPSRVTAIGSFLGIPVAVLRRTWEMGAGGGHHISLSGSMVVVEAIGSMERGVVPLAKEREGIMVPASQG